MTALDRLAVARRAAAAFRKAGLWRFAAEADARVAALEASVRHLHRPMPRRSFPPGHVAMVVRLPTVMPTAGYHDEGVKTDA